jgi:hypothetical protein
MRVLLGNPAPHQIVNDENGNPFRRPVPGGPRILEVFIPEGEGAYQHDRGDHTGDSLDKHFRFNRDVTKLGEGLEPFLSIAHPEQGHWSQHGADRPSWAWSDNEDLGRLLAEYFDCPFGIPADVASTHVVTGLVAGLPGGTA